MPTIDELAARLAVLVPVGSVVAFAGEVEDTGGVVEVPAGSGWLLCNGAAVNSGRFRQLFEAIQASHGNGQDNQTSPLPPPDFNLPDFRGLFLRGVTGERTDRDPNSSDAERPANHLGGNIGNRVGSVQLDEVGGHNHPINDPGHAHIFTAFRENSGAGGPGQVFPENRPSNPFGTSNSVTNITVLNSSGAESRPKNAYVHYIIRAQ